MLIHCKYQIDTTNNSSIAISTSKGVAGIVESAYGRRTCCVYSKAFRDEQEALWKIFSLRVYLGPFKLKVFQILLLMMPGSTPAEA